MLCSKCSLSKIQTMTRSPVNVSDGVLLPPPCLSGLSFCYILPATSSGKGSPQDPRPSLGSRSDHSPHLLSFPAGQAHGRRGDQRTLTSPVGGGGGWANFSPPRPRVGTAGGALALPGGLGSPPPCGPPTPSLPGFEKRLLRTFPFSFWRRVCSQSPRSVL